LGNTLDGVVSTGGYDEEEEEEEGLGGLKPRSFGSSDGYTLCWGLITGVGNRFCLQDVEECTVRRHQKAKAALEVGCFHILPLKTGWAYVSPTLDESCVTDFLSYFKYGIECCRVAVLLCQSQATEGRGEFGGF
jgi:hypothetical protein